MVPKFLFLLIFLLPCPFTNSLSLDVIKKKAAEHDHDHSQGHQSHNHTGVCKEPLYGENPYFTRRLFNVEEILAHDLAKLLYDIKYDTSPEGLLCFEKLRKYVREYHSDANAIEADRHHCSYGMQSRADIVAENPLFTLKMLRRLVISLISEALPECKSTKQKNGVFQTFTKVFENAALLPPDMKQLEVAIDGLLTLVFIYSFNVSSDLRLGKLNDHQTRAVLQFDDIIEVANRVLTQDEEGFMSYQWLMAAEQALASMTPEEDPEKRKLLFSYWGRALGNLGKRSINQMHREFGSRGSDEWNGFDFNNEHLCRGEYDGSAEGYTHVPLLICYYKMYHITPIKMEVHARAPFLIQFHDFLTNKEIQFIKYKSPSFALKPWEHDHEWSSESREAYHLDHFTRLAKEAMITNKDPVLVNLVAKIEKATRFKVAKENASIFEKALHAPLSAFWNVELNHDYVTGYSTNTTETPYASALLFLTDTHKGGNTAFPKLNVFAEPLKGSVLYFANYDWKANTKDERMFHEACPVIVGVKEVAHIPLHINPETFKRPSRENETTASVE